jgi:hypothetical protein
MVSTAIDPHAPVARWRPVIAARRDRLLPWALMVTSAWLVGGGYLDGWAHSHGKVDQTFFTLWHAVLYAGFGACAGVLLAATRRAPGQRWAWTLPVGYGLSLVGALIFAAGGLADLAWHLAFGIETDTAALLSPTHLVLYLGAALIVTGPLRAAWQACGGQPRGWPVWLPVQASLGFLFALLTFATQFAHPLVWPQASTDASRLSVGSQIYRMAADGSYLTPLVRAHGLDTFQPAWSPDGRHLAFTSRDAQERTWTLNIADADGSHPRVLLTDDQQAAPLFPDWSPDSHWIAFIGMREGQRDLFLLPATGGEVHRLTRLGVQPERPSWSPDGTRLAFTAAAAGQQR